MRCVHVDAVRVTMLDNVKNDELSWSAARESLHSSSWVSAVVVQLIGGGVSWCAHHHQETTLTVT
jgi:hypothetical protein